MTDKTILIVDDSPTIRDMLHQTLSGAGYHIVEARDGNEGIRKLDTDAIDCIITDVNMPNLDGLEMIEQVRRDPRHNAVPILVLTTETAPALKTRARNAGATGWIVKPFDPVKLMEAIRKVGA
ncbi:MAG TPA: response regulator [Rhizomicrobium sp.]|nr:response regulator [Rhizomicrobium sp.]